MFVVLEGIDGSGKTTVAQILKEELERYGRKVYLTFEPTDTKYGKIVKECVSLRNPFFITLAFSLDRAIHTEEIKKKIEEGYDVICDRYFYSTLAYEGAMLSEYMELEDALEWIDKIHKPIILKPDYVFLIDIPPKIGLERVGKRKNSSVIQFFEKEKFLEKVRDIYLKISVRYGMVVLDGNKSVENIVKEILRKINL